MGIALYQILVPLFCALMILKALSHFLRSEKTIREFIAWIVFWGLIAVLAFFPALTEHFAIILGIKSNVNAVVFTILGILSYISFKLLVITERQDHEITKLVRAMALDEHFKNDK